MCSEEGVDGLSILEEKVLNIWPDYLVYKLCRSSHRSNYF